MFRVSSLGCINFEAPAPEETIPKGLRTQIVGFLGPDTILIMVFGP